MTEQTCLSAHLVTSQFLETQVRVSASGAMTVTTKRQTAENISAKNARKDLSAKTKRTCNNALKVPSLMKKLPYLVKNVQLASTPIKKVQPNVKLARLGKLALKEQEVQ